MNQRDDEVSHIEGDLVRKLYQIEDMWDEMMSPTATITGSRSGGVLLPDDAEEGDDMDRETRVVDDRFKVMHCLRGWCQVIVEDHKVHYGIPSGTDVLGMVTFLLRWRTQCAEHEASMVILDEVSDCARLVRRHARPSRVTTMSLGPCPLTHQDAETSDDTQCTGTVRTAEGDASWAVCGACGTQAVATWWETKMFGDDLAPRLLDVPSLVTFLHRQYGRTVTRETVSRWVTSGAMPIAHRDEASQAGRVWFDRQAVVYALDRMGRWDSLVG